MEQLVDHLDEVANNELFFLYLRGIKRLVELWLEVVNNKVISTGGAWNN